MLFRQNTCSGIQESHLDVFLSQHMDEKGALLVCFDLPADCDDQAAAQCLNALVNNYPEMSQYIHIVCTGDDPEASSAILAALFSNNDENFDVKKMPSIYCGSTYKDSIGKIKTAITPDMLINPVTYQTFTADDIRRFGKFVQKLDNIDLEGHFIRNNIQCNLVIMSALPKRSFGIRLAEKKLIKTVIAQVQTVKKNAEYDIVGFNSDGWDFRTLVDNCDNFIVTETNLTKGVKYNGEDLNTVHLGDINGWIQLSALKYFEKMQAGWIFKSSQDISDSLSKYIKDKYEYKKDTNNSTKKDDFLKSAQSVKSLLIDNRMIYIMGSSLPIASLHGPRLVGEVLMVPKDEITGTLKKLMDIVNGITEEFLLENEDVVAKYSAFVDNELSDLILGLPTTEAEEEIYQKINNLQITIRQSICDYVKDNKIGIKVVLYDLGCLLFALSELGLVDINNCMHRKRIEYNGKSITSIFDADKALLGDCIVKALEGNLSLNSELSDGPYKKLKI